MGAHDASLVRPLKRTDLPRLVELKASGLAEVGRLDARLRSVPEARDRLPALASVWLGQEDRVVLVAEDPEASGPERPVVGYATGLLSVWPPIWRAQRTGEVGEVFVVSDRRHRGLGRALLQGVLDAMAARGVEALRAAVPARDAGSLALLHRLGFEPLMQLAERPFGSA